LVREGIELTAAPWAQPVATLTERTFRIHILDHVGKPAAKQVLSVARHAEGNQSAGSAFVGGPGGLSKRLANHGPGGQKFTADADGVVTIPGAKLFDRASATALVTALNADREEGAIGVLFADLEIPEITLRLSPFCDITASISREKLPNADSPTQICLQSAGIVLASTAVVNDHVDLQLPMGDYTLTIANSTAKPRSIQFSVKADQERLDLGSLALTPAAVVPQPSKPFLVSPK
jgi:hypothetical protein